MLYPEGSDTGRHAKGREDWRRYDAVMRGGEPIYDVMILTVELDYMNRFCDICNSNLHPSSRDDS